ncbi:MAG: arginase family protein [Gemmataceae bacterium]
MSTLMAFAPFDLFGSAGAGAGAQLLADAVRELLADNRRERQPSRARAYQDQVRLKEFTFETPEDYQQWPKRARQTVKQALGKKEFLFWVGGNHLSVLPVLEELPKNSVVIQFDAHLDVYNLTGCTTEPSHGNFLLHAAGPLPPIIHVGGRDLFLPADHVRKHFRETIAAEEVAGSFDDVLRRLRTACRGRRVWLDIDCDVLDPAFFPATGQPLPFGLTPQQLLRCLDAAWSERVAGVSLSEFEPVRDRGDQSLGLLVWLLEHLLLKRYEDKSITSNEEE